MSRYHTRFQARKAAQAQASQTQDSQAQASQAKVSQPYAPREDIEFVKARLEIADNLETPNARIQNAILIFSFLSVKQSLLHFPRFRSVVIDKIRHLRYQMEDEKKRAVETFITLYHPFQTGYDAIEQLTQARNFLAGSKQLEFEFKKVEAILYK